MREIRDIEYFHNLVTQLTTFELSSLVQILSETVDGRKSVAEQLDMEELSEVLTDDQCGVLIEHLAMRETIVDVLRSVNRSEWCLEGRRELKALLHKRKQLRLKLNYRRLANGNI